MDKLALLAALDEKDVKNLGADIKEILKLAEVLAEIEVDALPHGEKGDLRDDAPASSLKREALLGNAPCSKDGYIIVPKVVG